MRKAGVLAVLGLLVLLWVGAVVDSTPVVEVALEIRVHTSKGPGATDLEQVVVAMISSVPPGGTIDVMMAYLEEGDPAGDVPAIVEELLAAMDEGVKVRVLVREAPTCSWLTEMGINARRHTGIHHKVAVFPSAVMTGSANWTSTSLRDDWNDIVVIRNQDIRQSYWTVFEEAWNSVENCGS